jgi:outer membrane protein assembly factor BamB
MRRIGPGLAALAMLCAVVVCLARAPAAPARADDPPSPAPRAKVRPADGGWPEFLGPHRNGIAADKGLNWDWDKAPPRVLWKVPLGNGFSSLIVVGDRLYTMSQRGQRDVVVCLDAKTGKEIWACDAAANYVDRQKQGPGPRATPTFHEGKLYCQMARGELLCIRADDGKELWRKDIFKDTGAKSCEGEYFYWGVSFSPLVVDAAVIVQPGGTSGNSVVAFHKDSGKLLWKTGNDPINYGSPILINVAGQRQVVCPTGQSVLGLDPLKGTVFWRYPFGNQFNATGANPVWADGILFVSAAYGGGCAALELRRQDQAWQARPQWKSRKSLQALFATTIAHDGFLYGCHGDLGVNLLRCLDLKTGHIKWDQRLPGRSTLLGVDGHLLMLDERGTLHLVEMNPQRYVHKSSLPALLAYKAWAVPALAAGRLYLRDQHHVVCLDLRR